MYRNVLIVSAVALLTIGSANAQARAGVSGHAYMATERSITPGPGHLWDVPTAQGPYRENTLYTQYRLTDWQAEQLVRWGDVGKCVVAKDRESSLSYITAKRKSPQAAVAAKQLDPAFALCLEGSGIPNKANEGYRRAAIADAFGVRLSRGS